MKVKVFLNNMATEGIIVKGSFPENVDFIDVSDGEKAYAMICSTEEGSCTYIESDDNGYINTDFIITEIFSLLNTGAVL